MVANVTAFTSGRDLASVSENVELLTGQRGNKLDKAVTYRDLESLGVATLSRIGSSYSAKANPVLTTTASVVDTPTKPKNVQANGAFNTILIDWDEPDYRGHSYAEVWRAEVDNLSVAVKIGTSSANMYSDPIGGSAKVYYWVRFVNRNDVIGPYNASAGTYAETAENIQNILDALQGQIEASHLAQALLDDIAQIPIINSSVQAGATQIQQITVDLSSLNTRQLQAEAILKAAQDLLGSTTINVALLHDELSQKVLQYGADVQNLRDAILTVDPETGEITIDAINVVRTELQTNIDQVTQRVSSVEGTLTQKASSVEVNLQAQRISTVETQMNSINAELTNQVTRAEFTETAEDVTKLTNRMSAAEGSITQKATQQSVDQLGTRVATAESGLIAVNNDLQSKAVQISQIDSSYKAADAANSAATAENTAAITELSQSVSAANSATSTHLSELDSSVSGLNSSVTQLQQATSTNTETSASIYDQLKAKTDISAIAAASAALSDDESTRQKRYSEASIKHDLTVLTNDHEALAQTVEVLQADFASETAAISAQIANEQTARATAVDSLAQVVSTIDANYKSADITTNARIATEETARASADSALSTRVDQVLATTNSNTAAIQSEQTARTTADAALAQDIATLTASVGTNSAAIQSESTARASADSALTSLVNTAQAKADSAYSAVQTEITNRTTADSALSQTIATLQASVASNTAAIQSESTARASADSAQSTQINTVQAVLAGDPSNLFLNPNFLSNTHGFSGQPDANVHEAAYQWAPAGCPAPYYLEIWNRDVNGKTIPVVPGEVYHFSMSCATGDGGAPPIGIGCMALNASGGVMGYFLVANRYDATAEWKRISGEMTVPAGCTQIRMWVQLDYFRDATHNHWWAITGVQWTNANATKTLSASVQTQSQAISTLENGAQAMWTAKTQVGQITAGIGVMTDSNGKSQVMISASQLFMFDPNGAAPTRSIFAVSNGQVVIQKAVIEKATIETITAMSITADYVRAGVSLTSPNLVGGTLSIGSGDKSCFMEGGSIGIGKGGPYGGWGWGWHTIIYNDGGIYTDRLHASSGDFTGYVHATSGYFENVTISENCDVRGTIYANKIVGDVVASKLANKSTTYTISASPKTRVLTANVYISATSYVGAYSSGRASANAILYLDGVQVDSKSIVGPILSTASNSGTATASGVVGFHATVSANATHTFRFEWSGGDSSCVALLFAETTGSIS